MAAAAKILKAVVFGKSGIIRMRRTQTIACPFIVFAAGIRIFDEDGERGTGGVPFKPAADDADGIRLMALCGDAPFCLALRHTLLHVVQVQRQTGRQSVDHHADGFSVTFAKQRNLYVISKTVFHVVILSAFP